MDHALINTIQKKFSKPLVFVGMMGCGKSYIAARCAEILKCPLYDSDVLIEQDYGDAISEIFAREGEAAFRRLEAEKIDALLQKGCCVISAGGGAFAQEAVRASIQKLAISIWLDTDIEILLQRLEEDESRPLLQGGHMREKLQNLMEDRRALYAQADLKIVNNGRPEDALEEVFKALAVHLEL